MANVVTGAAAGLVGGLVGSWAMNQVPRVAEKFRFTSSGPSGGEPAEASRDEPSTLEVARLIWRTLSGRDVPPGSETTASAAVHFAFGAVTGAVYGAVSQLVPAVTAGRGVV